MQGAVDAAGFVDAVMIFRTGVVIARAEFLEWNFVGRVAVNLIGAQKNEHGLGTMLVRGFEEMEGAESVHLEVENRDIARLVVRRLRGAMDNQAEAVRSE